MPRRTRVAQELTKLNILLQSKASIDESDSDSYSFKKDEDPEERNGPDAVLRRALEVVPHFTCPALNAGMLGQQLQEMDEDEDQIYPSCAVGVPIPVFLPPDGHSPHVEPCIQRSEAYYHWMRLSNVYKIYFEKNTKKMKQREKKQQEKIYDVKLFEMAEHIAGQENPFFRDSYDYYYTGGNVNTMPYQGSSLAMHVSGRKLNELHFTEINSEPNMWKTIHSEKLQETSSELFQILPVDSFRVNHGHMFLARFLNELSIYELKEELETEEYQLICQSKFSSQAAPFISASQSLGKPNLLALACQDRSIRFLDILTQQDVAKHEVCWVKGLLQNTSTWAQLMPATSSTFHFLTQPVLLTVDVRCDQPLNPCYASSFQTQTCETFSCMAKSVNPHLLYVASNHKLHCLDLRCLGKNLTDRAVVTWTHHMKYPATFMDLCAHDGSEYAALGSLLPGDQRICELKGPLAQSVDEMFSPALAYAPPTLEEALGDARLRGLVDIYADLTERVKTCVTGLRFSRLENASDRAFAQLLTANSLGDLYSQRLTPRDECERLQEIRTGLHTTEAIRHYGSQVQKYVPRTELRCTEVKSIPQIRDIFREATKRPPPDVKPPVVEDIEIEWGIEDTDISDGESTSSEEPDTVKGKRGANKKAKKKAGQKKLKNKIKKKLERESKDKPPVKFNFRKDKGINRGSWQKSAYQMARFTDMLTVRMLEIWDMEDYDPTRDVSREMIQERLPEELKPETRMANWLNQLSSQPAEPRVEAVAPEEERNPNLVPGTNLPKLYDAISAEYSEVITIPISSQPEQLPETTRRPSLLLPGENTIIEYDFEIKSPPAKRPKTKYVKGF